MVRVLLNLHSLNPTLAADVFSQYLHDNHEGAATVIAAGDERANQTMVTLLSVLNNVDQVSLQWLTDVIRQLTYSP
jgi:hypothetical protein